MMNRKKNIAILTLAIAATGMAAASASAQNPGYTPGDLVLTFQNPGGSIGSDRTLYVSLGNTATLFRQGEAGVGGAVNLLNIVNIGDALISAFGANWASEITLHAGLSGVWGTSPLAVNTLQNGDPNRTLYVSSPRLGLGTVGQANSTAWAINTDTGMTNAANGMMNQNTVFEVNGTSGIYMSLTDESTIDDQNPISGGLQGNAFNNVFAGGIQQQGSAGSFGNFGQVENVEFALDLYRILAKTNAPGQVDGPGRVGTYEGTVVIDQDGDVSFVTTAVPEPSAGLLLAASLGMAGFIRHRRRTA